MLYHGLMNALMPNVIARADPVSDAEAALNKLRKKPGEKPLP
jgi:hypothetical protein